MKSRHTYVLHTDKRVFLICCESIFEVRKQIITIPLPLHPSKWLWPLLPRENWGLVRHTCPECLTTLPFNHKCIYIHITFLFLRRWGPFFLTSQSTGHSPQLTNSSFLMASGKVPVFAKLKMCLPAGTYCQCSLCLFCTAKLLHRLSMSDTPGSLSSTCCCNVFPWVFAATLTQTMRGKVTCDLLSHK